MGDVCSLECLNGVQKLLTMVPAPTGPDTAVGAPAPTT